MGYNGTEVAATAYFSQFEKTLYMSMDVSCETGTDLIEPCLQKDDLIFITDANWGQALSDSYSKNYFGAKTTTSYIDGYADTTDLYTITKIWKAEETATTSTVEDKFRITVDKAINWDGSTLADPDGTARPTRATCRSLSSRPRRPATTSTSPCARTAASATATTASASASRATRTTTATRSRRSPSRALVVGNFICLCQLPLLNLITKRR